MTRRSKIISLLLSPVYVFVLQSTNVNAQTIKEAVGYDALVLEKMALGMTLEDGTGIVVVQAEAPSDDGAYLPNPANLEFAAKTFTDGTGTNVGSLSHANSVGAQFYGNSSSMTPGITDITGYDANHYINNVLGVGTGAEPLAQGPGGLGFHVGNHSYVNASALTGPQVIDRNQRMDFLINRDNTLMVVGASNGGVTPQIFATSYNAITVGLSDGGHSTGVTADYGPGRLKPDIVAPHGTTPANSFTSFATPIVGSAAALLRQAGAGTNAIQNEVIKSTLFAGATKDDALFGGTWGANRTTTQPIDEVYGYGELNILNSYHIFEGGEFAASTSNPTASEAVGLLGWDLGTFNGSDQHYEFEILAGQSATELSAALVWNAVVTDSQNPNNFDLTTTLANLDLRLYDSSGGFLDSLLDSSLSTVYNTEHIYLQNLAAGSYTFKISGDAPVDNYGFSWRITTVPEPSGVVLLGLVTLGAVSRRRRVPNQRA